MMKSILFTIAILSASLGMCQNIVGKWKTIDDKTGRVKSVVEITERNGLYYGKVIQLFRLPEEDPNPKCWECDDDRKNQLVQGMEILRDMKWNGSMYKDGSICDPKNGSVYTCEMWLKPGDSNTLEVRGYWGWVFRTQNWVRTK
jgi:uncharacterized protein (DUF2147 family)